MSAPADPPTVPVSVPVPADMLHTLLNGLEFARNQGAFNGIPLQQLYILTGVQLHLANLVNPPASEPPPNA